MSQFQFFLLSMSFCELLVKVFVLVKVMMLDVSSGYFRAFNWGYVSACSVQRDPFFILHFTHGSSYLDYFILQGLVNDIAS